MRKSIVFDKNTPDVFYCPQHKPIGFEKMLVKARPLSRLCQFEGRPIPEDYKSDCYNDVDETEYACKEKYRIMVSVEFTRDRDKLRVRKLSEVKTRWLLKNQHNNQDKINLKNIPKEFKEYSSKGIHLGEQYFSWYIQKQYYSAKLSKF